MCIRDRYRTLARQRPNAFNPNLAGSLNNLANMLADLGRQAEADAVRDEIAAL